MWFEKLTGFKEGTSENIRKNLAIEGDTFISKINGERFSFGMLEIPTLLELKQKANSLELETGVIKVSETIGDIQSLHKDIQNENALFQAASQFNLLEMISPNILPEHGIDIYENDYTQGPACAIACGAGTIYRNYFIKLGEQTGQSYDKQVDCLELIGKTLDNQTLKLWSMRNGYAMFTKDSLEQTGNILSNLSDTEIEELKEKLKIGIQWNTEVTISETRHKVSQIYCSALPISYCDFFSEHWEKVAKLILEATYEATFYSAIMNFKKYGSNKVFLTLVGGGAFGNEIQWVIDSIEKTILKFKKYPLDVRIVSFGSSKEIVRQLILKQ